MSAYLGDRATVIDVDAPTTIAAIVLLAVIGPCMFILQPAYVQGLVEYLRFSEEQAGMIASAEMFGLAASAIGVNFVLQRLNWRILAFCFLLISLLGNLASLALDNERALAGMRFITGLGSGGLISITFTMMGLTARADRNIGLIVASVLTYGAFGLLMMPSALHLVGVKGVLAFFAVFSAAGLLVVHKLPCSDQGEETVEGGESSHPLRQYPIALLGVLAYNIAIGIVWVYMFLVGVRAGISEQAVANALTVSQFLGIGGAAVAVFFEVRFGRLLPLMTGILGGAAGIALLLGEPGITAYMFGVCLFNFLWNLTLPYMLALLAELDASGRLVTVGVALQMLGFAVGPALAAAIYSGKGFDTVNGVAIVLFVLAATLLWPALRSRLGAAPAGGIVGGQPG